MHPAFKTNPEQFQQLIAPLFRIHRRDCDPETLVIWYERIADKYHAETIKNAVDRLIDESETMPKPATLLKTCKEIAQRRAQDKNPDFMKKDFTPASKAAVRGIVERAKQLHGRDVAANIADMAEPRDRQALANTPGYDSGGNWSTALFHEHLARQGSIGGGTGRTMADYAGKAPDRDRDLWGD